MLILSPKSTQAPEFADNWRLRPLVAATANGIAVDDKLWQRLLAGHYKAIGAKDFHRRHHVALARSMCTSNALDVADGSAISSTDRSLAYVRALATHDGRAGRHGNDEKRQLVFNCVSLQ